MTKLYLSFFLPALLLAVGAPAQEEATAFDISLANPGARSLGFGGAFLPLADDATATFANPAGLAQFLEPELTFELRGQVIKTGVSTAERQFVAADDEGTILAFLAFVYPFKRGAVAIYTNGFGNITVGNRIRGLVGGRALDIGIFNQFGIASTGLSASYRLSENFSIGAGVAQWDGDLSSTRVSMLTGGGTDEGRLTRIDTTDDSDLTFNAGFLWRFADQWRLGGVYRGGPEFGLRSERSVVAPSPPRDRLPAQVRQFPFLLPDVLGLGIAFKTPGESLTLSFEWDLVRYSRLLDGMGGPSRRDFDLDDGHELHLGFEYVIVRSRPVIALRLGTWREPDHLLRYLGDDPIDRATFTGGDAEMHYAMGLGFAFKSLKLDLAFDTSELTQTGSFTLIYSF